jgi:filamentous hemagglutinin family protein
MRKKTTNEQLHTQPQFRLKPVYAAVLLAVVVQTAQANPIGGTVAAGQASFATTGNTLNVTNTPGTIINWQGFSIGANEITHFAQQSASSAVLNRVISNNPSSILGTLQSNGRVFLINPGGIVFGAGATVDVAGMVASTLNLSNADFLAGRNHFTQVPGSANVSSANVSNAGNITAQNGGQIYLLAPDVENTGVITAPNGEILLAAGYSVDLVSTTNPNLRVNITAPAGDATNVGQLIAQSGSLGLFGTVVRNSGTVSADSATLQGGKIVFKATQRTEISGTVSATGTTGGSIQALGNEVQVTAGAVLDASGANGGGTVLVGGDAHGANPNVQNAQTTYVDAAATIKADATQNGNGGKVVVWSDNATQFNGNISAQGGALSGNGGWVEVSGKQKLGYAGLTNTLAANGLSGTLLLDPDDFFILASGGSMTGLALSASLGTSNVIITTAPAGTTVVGASFVPLVGSNLGDIYVSDTVSWATTNTLTLNSYRIIALNSPITATLGSLILNAGVGGLSTAYIVDVGNLTLASLVANAPAGGTGTTLTGINTLGALDVQSGGVTGTGTLNVSSGATSLTGTFAANTLNMTGGTLSLDGAATTTLPTLNLSSGTLTGTGNIVIPNSSATGIFNWTGGTLSGTGSFATTPGSGPVAGFQPTATTMNGTLTLSRPFNNYGVMSQGVGALTLTVTPLGSLTNIPTVGVSGGTLILGNGATGGSIIVNGILSNLGGLGAVGTGISSVDASGATIGTISNAGIVGVAAGIAINAGATLNWTAGQTANNTGAWGIGSTTTPTFGGVLNLGVAPLGGAQTYSGAFLNVGTVNVNAGTNTLSGAFTNNGQLQFATGTNSLTGTYSEAQLGFAPTITFTSGTNTVSALSPTGGALTLNSLSANGGFNTLDTDSTITNLSIGAATLTGLGNITIPTTGVFNWSGGTLATTGAATLTLNNVTNPSSLYQGTLTLNRALINNGVVSQQSVNGGFTTTLNIGAGGSFSNNGTFNMGNAVASAFTVDVSDTGTFTNSATTGIINSAGTVINTIQATMGATTVGTIANNGAIDIAAGNTLKYLGGQTATNAGTFTTAAGGVLNLGASAGAPVGATYNYSGTITNNGATNFAGGTHTLDTSSSISGAGDVSFSNGTTNVDGAYVLTGATNISGGTANFSGSASTVGGSLSAGALGGGGTLTVSSGTFNWTGGAMAGGGTLAIPTGSVLNMTGGSMLFLDGYTINNAGTVNWSGATTVRADTASPSAITNQYGGQFNASATGSIFNNGGGGPITFTNDLGATFTRSGTGTSTIGVTFDNNGQVNVNAGTLTLTSFPTNAGTLNVASAATFNQAAGFTNTGTLSGTGTIAVGTGASGLVNQGNINPGGTGATGTLAITGDVQLITGSNLNMELGGTGAGQFDKLAVTGSITTAGALNASLLAGYTPANADAIPFMTMGGTAIGTFATTSLPANFNVGYNFALGEAARLIYAGGSTITFTVSAAPPAVVDEIIDTSNQRPKKPEDVIIADASNSKGTDLQSLPMCRP